MKIKLIKIIFVIFLLKFSPFCIGQSEFLRQYQVNGTMPKSMAQLSDSGYVIVENYSLSSDDLTFRRLDKFGSIIWYKRASLSGDQNSLKKTIVTSLNKVVTTYQKTSNNSFGVLFLDSSVNVITQKQFSHGTSFYEGFQTDIAESPDKKIYVLGTNHLVKFDSVGNVIWQKRFTGYDMNLVSVHPISSSKLILTGFANKVQSINSNYDIVQICINSSGTILWSKSFGSQTQEKPLSSIYSNGKIYISGIIDNYLSNRKGDFILCTDTIGTQLWCKWIDDKGNYNRLKLLKDGTLVLLEALSNNYCVTRYSESGDYISGIKLNSPLALYVRDFISTNDGGIYMEAATSLNSNTYGIKMSANLNPECIAFLQYSPDSMFNQVLDEMPFLCTTGTVSTVTNVNSTWTFLASSSLANCISNCNVIASFKPDKTMICQGESINFENNSVQSTSYQWWIGTSLISTTSLLTYSFSTPGQYRVKLVATNGICTDSTFAQIIVRAPLPQPQFTYQKDHFKGYFNTTVPTFGSVSWNFGDGTGEQKDIDSLVHNFKAAGTYNICLYESNVCGTVSTCQNITFTVDSTFQFIKNYNENSFYDGNRWAKGTQSLYGGGFLLTGIDDTWGATGWEGTVLKTDKKGNPIWTQIVTQGSGSGNNIEITHITETYKGFLLLGGTNGASPYLGIMDSSGLMTYYLRLTSSSQGAVSAKPIEKPNGNIIFSGCYGDQAFITESNSALGLYWFKRHNGVRTLYSTIKTSGGYLMAGTDISNTQIGLMKVDENGDYVSACKITHSGSTPTDAREIIESLDGNFLLTGNSNGSVYIMKIDQNYNVIWTKKYSLSGFGKSISTDDSGNIYVVTSGGVVLKTNSLGNVIWAWSPSTNSNYSSVRHGKTLDGGLIVASTSYGYFSSQENELSLFRFDNSGNMPSCIGTPLSVNATTIVANLTLTTDVQTNGAPSLTKYYSGNLYDSYQAVICSSGSLILEADFTEDVYCLGTATEFSDLSLGNVVSYNWNFQGGTPSTSTSVNPSVTWNTSGIYSVSLTITGIDGSTNTTTHNVVISDLPIADAGSDLVACSGSPVTLNGNGIGTLFWNPSTSISNPTNAITSANPLTDELFILNSISGNCTVTDTMSVIVKPAYLDTISVSLCSGLSYFFQGQNYSTTGNYSVPYTTVDGCDSIFTLNLLVNPPLSSNISIFICDGEDYTIGSSVFSSTGLYSIPLQNQSGCDSIVNLNLTVILPATTVNAEICSGEIYQVGSNIFSNTGTYTINLLNQNGCDSTVTLNLTVLPNSSSIINAEICPGESYFIGSNSYSTSGTFTSVIQSVNGCDSTVTLNLLVKSLSTSEINAIICQGETFSLNGIDYSGTGSYVEVFTSVNGCDSIVNLNLTELFVSPSNTNAVICSGETYTFNGTNYWIPGTYSVVLQTSNGCDSIANLNLTENIINPTIYYSSICSGEQFEYNGMSYTLDGFYFDTLQSITGCDSVIIIDLEVFPVYTTILNETICFGESYFIQGNEYTTNGVFSDTLQALSGCDSIIILNLSVTPLITSNLNESICSGESYFIQGNEYTAEGIYIDTLQTINGCDSIVNLNLTVFSVYSSIQNETICSGDSFYFQGNMYTIGGVYTDTIQTLNGCDSISTLDLTVISPNIGVSILGNTLTSNQNGADYIWFDCNNQSIIGNTQSITGNLNGIYAVIVTWNNCSDTSICHTINDVGITDLDGNSCYVYPVPSNNIIYLITPLDFKNEPYFLIDGAGKIILEGTIDAEKTEISIEKYSVGMYQLKVGNEGMFFKVIRQ